MGSNIKGGGRAILSDEAEEELISFLMSRRQQQQHEEKSSVSNHHRKREQKRFLKQLVERYERIRLANKFNSSSNSDNNKDDKTTSATKTNKSLKGGNAGGRNQKSSSGSGDGGKVRVNLVEAIYGKGKKKGGTKSKQQQDNIFKEGGKKLAVYPRISSVQDLMKDFQTKLRMKKKPIRCFIVENKMEVNLTGDLSGVSDGATMYITSQPPQQQEDEVKEEKEELTSDGKELLEDEIDPLDLVKQAYLQRDRRQPKKATSRQPTVQQPHPEFDQHFTELEPLSEERACLPAASCRETILQKVQNNRVVVICGMTGCGKSTQIPQFLWEGMKASGCSDNANIIVTQPRRVAATSLAQRVSNEMKSTMPGDNGSLVGYNVRLDRAVADSAKIVYCTVGILLRMLLSPREGGTESSNDGDTDDNALQPTAPLSSVSHVVIDEVHERDMNTDFVLTLLRSYVLSRNQHIRIVLMSATASATKFVRYFEETVGIEPAVITIPGRTFPVDMHWLEDCEKFAGSRLSNRPEIVEESIQQNGDLETSSSSSSTSVLSPRATQKIDNRFVNLLICALVRGHQQAKTAEKEKSANGAVLVFLPGKGEIDALAKVLYDDPLVGDRDRCNILKLHSGIPKASQQIVFKPAKTGTTKIVLATNIAETSLTIPDIKHVIDTGRVKENRFNSSTRISELVTVWTSRASAKQRSGRAGRTSAGKCWRLYTEQFSNDAMLEQTPPEMLRTPLDELILQVCLLWEQRRDEQQKTNKEKGSPNGLCPKTFLSKTPDPPTDDNLDKACEHLLEVDAMRVVSNNSSNEEAGPVLYRLTPIGYHLSRLPMDTKVGKVLLVGCMLGCLDSALTVAASLSCTKSCFLQQRWNGSSVDQQQFDSIQDKRNHITKTGFGGEDWIGGTSKGDLICAIATYNEWSKRNTFKKKMAFCRDLSLDSVGLNEISQLRDQFLDCLVDAGLASSRRDSKDDNINDRFNNHKDDALLTSCCFVAGLYPNVCTLMRPRKGGPRGGRLITKDGDICRPSSSSFQRTRVQKAAEVGKDAYAVFHAKHRTIGATSNSGTKNMPSGGGGGRGDIFLSEVNFVSRMAILLFGGELEINKNAVIVDGWLKFKIGDKGLSGAVLISALRDELDNCILRQLVSASGGGGDGCGQQDEKKDKDTETLISIVRKLLSDE